LPTEIRLDRVGCLPADLAIIHRKSCFVYENFSISHKRQTDEISAGAEAVIRQIAQNFPKVGDFNAVYHCITFPWFCQEVFSKKFIFFHIFFDLVAK
jgi:hypothetical protein